MAFDTTPIETLWRTQAPDPAVISLVEIRARTLAFERRLRDRRLREYAAAVFVAACFGVLALVLPNWIMKLGCAGVVAGTALAMRRHHRHGLARSAPPEASAQTLVAFYRAELVRHHDLVRDQWRWLVTPVLPGMALVWLGWFVEVEGLTNRVKFDPSRLSTFVMATVIVVLGLVIVRLRISLACARLQTQIDKLDRRDAE